MLVSFDPGGLAPALFAHMEAASFDVLTWRKGSTQDLEAEQFTETTFTDNTGRVHRWMLAATPIELAEDKERGPRHWPGGRAPVWWVGVVGTVWPGMGARGVLARQLALVDGFTTTRRFPQEHGTPRIPMKSGRKVGAPGWGYMRPRPLDRAPSPTLLQRNSNP